MLYIYKKLSGTMLRIMILILLLASVASSFAAEHEECIDKTGHNHSSVDGQDAIDRAIDKAAISERQYFIDSCCHRGDRGEYSCQSSCFNEASTTPVLLGQITTLSQHEAAISFFIATDPFSTNENYRPPLRPPIF